MKLPIKRTNNAYGNPVVHWKHWTVRPRLWLYDKVSGLYDNHGWAWAFKLYSKLYDWNVIINGDCEDCWCGGYELGEND